jgi:hypothetical protein
VSIAISQSSQTLRLGFSLHLSTPPPKTVVSVYSFWFLDSRLFTALLKLKVTAQPGALLKRKQKGQKVTKGAKGLWVYQQFLPFLLLFVLFVSSSKSLPAKNLKTKN